MKTIQTLVPDILALVDAGSLNEFATKRVYDFADKLALRVSNRLSEDQHGNYLRLSNLGTRCERQLFLKINMPELVEKLRAETKVKFLYGDLLEELLLFLAREAGHDVADEQREVEIAGVKGHIDAIIDGVLVDVKSASTASFEKFRNHLTEDQDAFGYLTQLGAYAYALGQPLAGFLAIDKTLGNVCLDLHEVPDIDYAALVTRKRAVLLSGEIPERAYVSEADGKSGNEKLGTACSYCPVKQACWPGLRTFAYSNGPRFLTAVRRTPEVPEIK